MEKIESRVSASWAFSKGLPSITPSNPNGVPVESKNGTAI
jgi:hypothetical protein